MQVSVGGGGRQQCQLTDPKTGNVVGEVSFEVSEVRSPVCAVCLERGYLSPSSGKKAELACTCCRGTGCSQGQSVAPPSAASVYQQKSCQCDAHGGALSLQGGGMTGNTGSGMGGGMMSGTGGNQQVRRRPSLPEAVLCCVCLRLRAVYSVCCAQFRARHRKGRLLCLLCPNSSWVDAWLHSGSRLH